jgi:hypothetical protein
MGDDMPKDVLDVSYLVYQQQSAYRLMMEKQERLEAKLDAIRALIHEHLQRSREALENVAIQMEANRSA